MECTLAALIACFSWSGFYVESGLSYQRQQQPTSEYITVYTETPGGNFWREQLYFQNANPYVPIAIGYEVSFRNVKISLSAEHRSSIATSEDDGLDFVTLKARWYPFLR